MTEKQRNALADLCGRYGVPFRKENFTPQFDLPDDWVAGWIGDKIFVGCSPEGEIHS